LRLLIIPPPEVNKVPHHEEERNSRQRKNPDRPWTENQQYFYERESEQDRKPQVDVSHPLFPKQDDKIPLPDRSIRLLVRKLVHQDHVENRETDREGEEKDLVIEKTGEEIKPRCDRQPSVTEPDEDFTHSPIGPSKRFAGIEESAEDSDASQEKGPRTGWVPEVDVKPGENRSHQAPVSQNERYPGREYPFDQDPGPSRKFVEPLIDAIPLEVVPLCQIIAHPHDENDGA